MKKDLEEYYSRYLELFLLPGWGQLMEELQETVEQLSDPRTIKDQRDLDYCQGELRVLDHLLNFEATQRRAIEVIETEEADDI